MAKFWFYFPSSLQSDQEARRYTGHETPSTKARFEFWVTGIACKEIMQANLTEGTSTGQMINYLKVNSQ